MGFVRKIDLLILWHCGTVEPDNTSRPTDGGEEEAMSVQLSGTTTMLGLIGTPVAHSKSPAMYNHCFARYGLDWAYLAFDVTQEKAGAAVQAIRTLHMRGANVTMPCKNAVIPYLDRLSPEARAIGAVNVIVNDDGVLTGYNTDGMGYTQNLRRHGAEVKGKRIVLLGGGGAASAIAGQAALEGAAEIAVFNRRDEFWPRVAQTLQTITQAAPECTLSLHDLDDGDDLREAVSRCDILSNATRVGMAPEVEHSIITDRSWFRPELVVTDVVYAPPETKLLRDARSAGCRTCDGLGMLLCQGAEAFRLYSGLEMPIEEIRALLYT